MLLGEYAVLEGAPAVVAALDRRARVQVMGSRTWRITAPQIEIRDLPLADNGAVPGGLAPRQQAALAVYAAVHSVVIERTGPLPPLSIHIDSGAFYRNGNKLGLGSSAAVAVALSAAIAAAGGLAEDRETIFSLAIEAHRRAQGGLGSGADVAASTYGGVIVHRQGRKPVAIPMPEDLLLLALDTGISASTPRLLEAVYGLRRSNSGDFEICIGRLIELAEKGADSLQRGDTAAFSEIAEVYYCALADLGNAAGADIVSDVHRRLHGIVRKVGGSYKPSGAGGGDFGLALVDDSENRRAVAEAVTEAGFCAIDFSLATSGVNVSEKR